MRAWIEAALVVLVCGALIGSLYLGHTLGTAQEREKHQAEEKARREGQDAALQAAAKAIAKIEVKSGPIKESLVREITTVPVYRDCQHSPDGLRYLNELITGESAASPSASGVPGTDPN
jgi:hypothetical protein